ncbi:MAG: DsbA family protein [Chloroflexota bacterium]
MDPSPTPSEDRSGPARVGRGQQPTEEGATGTAVTGTAQVDTADEAVQPVEVAPVGARRPGDPGRRLGQLAAAAVGALLMLTGLIVLGVVGTPAGARLSAASPSAPPSPAATFATDGATVGVAGAPVTIEVWADFQCPYCGLFSHGIEPTILREYAATGAAQVRFRDFAFLGPESVDAAVGARCAGREGKFWLYHDLLYASQRGENQGAFRRDTLLALAEFAGLAKEAFTACLDDPAVAREVAAETAAGRELGIESTPTLRIVGPGATRIITGVSTPGVIAEAIAAAAAPSSSPGAEPSGSPAGSATP